MPVYAVFEPPMRQRGDRIERDRSDLFVFLREGFNLWAFLFGPLWMIRRRLWLVLIVYAAVIAGLEFGLRRLGIAWPARLEVYLLIELLIGIEAANLRHRYRRWSRTRRTPLFRCEGSAPACRRHSAVPHPGRAGDAGGGARDRPVSGAGVGL